MPDPSWASSPPEVNYLRLAGAGAAGAASTLASGAAWQAVAAGNEVAASASTLNTATTAADFQGVGGVSSATRAAGLNSALHLLSGWAQQKVPIAATAAEAYHGTVAAMIPAEVSLANRAEQAANVALNPLVLGALTPAIVALDAIYFGEHWPHNASAGIAYGTTLAGLAAALAVPPPLTPPGAGTAAPAAAAAAQAAGQAAAGEVLSQSAQLASAPGEASAAPAQAAAHAAGSASQAVQSLGSAIGAGQPLNGMFAAPVQAFQALSGLAARAGSGAGEPSGQWEAGIPGLTAMALHGAGAGGSVSPIEPGGAGTRGAGLGAGIGGAPSAGLTSYARPASGFASENPGRPATLKPGPLGATELRGPTVLGPSVVPAGAAPTGMLSRSKPEDGKDSPVHARVSVDGGRPLVRRHS